MFDPGQISAPPHPRPRGLPEVEEPTPGDVFARRIIFAVLCGVVIVCVAEVTFLALQSVGG